MGKPVPERYYYYYYYYKCQDYGDTITKKLRGHLTQIKS